MGPNYSGVPGGYVRTRAWAAGTADHRCGKHGARLGCCSRPFFDLSGYTMTAPALAPPSKGRLIRCTVPGSTPKRFAMTRTPGLPGVAKAFLMPFGRYPTPTQLLALT